NARSAPAPGTPRIAWLISRADAEALNGHATGTTGGMRNVAKVVRVGGVRMMMARTVVAKWFQYAQLLSMAAILLSADILLTAAPARASYKTHHKHAVSHHHRHARTPTVDYHALLLEDADTGR